MTSKFDNITTNHVYLNTPIADYVGMINEKTSCDNIPVDLYTYEIAWESLIEVLDFEDDYKTAITNVVRRMKDE